MSMADEHEISQKVSAVSPFSEGSNHRSKMEWSGKNFRYFLAFIYTLSDVAVCRSCEDFPICELMRRFKTHLQVYSNWDHDEFFSIMAKLLQSS